MIVIIATPKLFQWACHCRWLYTYTMLVPHFWQVWVFLTPPTDVAGLGALGESFPGNRRAASGVKHKHTHTREHINTAAHWDVLTVSLFITSTLCLSSPLSVSGACLCFPTRHHQLSTRGTRFMKWVSTHWSLSLHERMSLLSGCIRPAVYQGRGGKGGHMHFMICCSQHKRHTGELFSTSCTGDGHMEPKLGASNSHSLVLH